jgi:erythromycin esterase-like protein
MNGSVVVRRYKNDCKNFNIGFWYTKEIVNLLEWMREYNIGKTTNKFDFTEWIFK